MDFHIIASLPIVLYCYKIFRESSWTTQYLNGPCSVIKADPLIFLMTLMVIHLNGFGCLSHYQLYYQECSRMVSNSFLIYGVDKIRALLMLAPSFMLSWKLFLLQRRLVQQYAPQLLESKYGQVLDIDGINLVSYSKGREGADFGYSKRFRGRPLLQGSASFIGNIFIDFALFAGWTNTATFFQKAVKRAISLGYRFVTVRADALYGQAENLLFLEKLSLSYAIGIPSKLVSLQEGRRLFAHLARENSSRIIHLAKGVAILSLGLVNVAEAKQLPCFRHVIICRRIHRRKKKNGKRTAKTYYYAIVTNLDWTPVQIFRFYHQRQCIENGFKELRYHYALNSFCKNGQPSLKINELWMATKILAMTMFKIFKQRVLPKRFRRMRRKTLLRELLATGITRIENNKVVLRRNHKHLWHLKRIFSKLEQDKFLQNPFKIAV